MEPNENINKTREKIDLLKSLGYEIVDGISKVNCFGVIVDFSAVECDLKSISYHATSHIYKKGKTDGIREYQGNLKRMLGFDVID